MTLEMEFDRDLPFDFSFLEMLIVTDLAKDVVRFAPQQLTEPEKVQARENMGAFGNGDNSLTLGNDPNAQVVISMSGFTENGDPVLDFGSAEVSSPPVLRGISYGVDDNDGATVGQVKEIVNQAVGGSAKTEYFDITEDGLVSLKPEYRGTGHASYEYSVSNNGVGKVGSKNSELPAALVIPDIVNKIAVKALAPSMFMLNDAVKSITIPSGITVIPARFCVRALQLKEIHGTSNIQIIEHGAFKMSALKKVSFPNLRELTGTEHFAGCAYLVSADIGDMITELSDSCFYYCEMLESISGGANLTKIGNMALRGTHRLKNVSFAQNLKEIGKHGFNASGLNHYWHTHYGCDCDTYATPAQWNPTDYWSGCTYKPCVTQLRSTFHQENPAWNDAALKNVTDLTETEKGYVDNCVTNAAAMAYSALEGVDISSPADFIRAVKAKDPSVSALPVSDPDGTKKHFEALGYEAELCYYGEDLQKLYDALAEGHLVVGTILGQNEGYNGHAALFYGVTENGEIMACDSESYRSNFGDYSAVTYAKRIQNMAIPVRTSEGVGVKEPFTIIKKTRK